MAFGREFDTDSCCLSNAGDITNGGYPLYWGDMRGKDQLTPFQYTLLEATERLRAEGVRELHPYGLTKILEDSDGDRRWIGYWPLSRNGAGTYAKASSFLDSLTAPDRIGGGVARAPRVD